jgi:hypothetical protein
MKEFTVYFCQKDLMYGSIVVKRDKTMKGNFIPRIGELLFYNKSYWEVIEVSHEYDENTECIKTFIKVI